MSKPDDRAVILIATMFILHTSVYDAADGLVNVIRTNVLQVLDHLQSRRLTYKHIPLYTVYIALKYLEQLQST